ncbi:MAG TPA: glycosyltransferase family 2 protein [Saprospiraceae bacterium]|nr:glycosyltransferase family 2 protein [Saprospiraceae bacterium]
MQCNPNTTVPDKALVIDLIIPALNEAKAIGLVLQAIPINLVRRIIVCDNGSTDDTVRVASSHGAVVLHEPEKGYGAACLKALEYISNTKSEVRLPDAIGFLDADYSDFPEDLIDLTEAMKKRNLDLVIGSRVLGDPESGSLTPIQKFGNALSTKLIKYLFGYQFTDLGPFRLIKYDPLARMKMADRNFGWTVEMQVKAAKMSLNCGEVPVRYRRRIGQSKISGTVKGSFLAGKKILLTIFREKWIQA